MKPFSVIHLNVRSTPANLPTFQPYINIPDHHYWTNGKLTKIIDSFCLWHGLIQLCGYYTTKYRRRWIISIHISNMNHLVRSLTFLECLFVKLTTSDTSYLSTHNFQYHFIWWKKWRMYFWNKRNTFQWLYRYVFVFTLWSVLGTSLLLWI